MGSGVEAVHHQMPSRRLVGRLRRIYGNHPPCPPADGGDGKGPGIGKTVQDRQAPTELLDLSAVVPLIEEKTRLLTVMDIDIENEAVFPDGNGGRRFLAPDCFPALFQTFQTPRRSFTPLQDAPGVAYRCQGGNDLLPSSFHPDGADAHHQIVPVAIHHQAGDAVPFRIDQPPGIVADRQDSFPEGCRLPKAPPPEIAVHPDMHLPRKHPEGDIRPGMIKAQGQRLARRRAGQDDVSRVGMARRFCHRPGKQPGVSVKEGTLPAGLQNELRIISQ